MKRVETILEQAQQLRQIAGTFDDPVIKRQMLDLADRCEQLAASMTDAIDRSRKTVEPPVH